jgi:hypothetical protein
VGSTPTPGTIFTKLSGRVVAFSLVRLRALFLMLRPLPPLAAHRGGEQIAHVCWVCTIGSFSPYVLFLAYVGAAILEILSRMWRRLLASGAILQVLQLQLPWCQDFLPELACTARWPPPEGGDLDRHLSDYRAHRHEHLARVAPPSSPAVVHGVRSGIFALR